MSIPNLINLFRNFLIIIPHKCYNTVISTYNYGGEQAVSCVFNSVALLYPPSQAFPPSKTIKKWMLGRG